MPRGIYSGEENYNIEIDSSQNPDITIASINTEQQIALLLFYKWKE